jgi:hypothetical protein
MTKKLGLCRLFVALLVLAAIVVFPAGTALAYPPANPSRVLPGSVQRGGMFNVTVNFTAPANNFFLVSLTDFAPAGWNVTANETWCTPKAASVKTTGNKTEIIWGGSFNNGTFFTAVYKVAVPEDAAEGFHTFTGYLKYYIGDDGPYLENTTGDSQVFFPPEFDVIRHINETLKSPNVLYRGDTFEVSVNWTAPLNNFSAIGLTDLAPAGFTVEANKTWCSPTANETKATGNKVEIAWYGPYANGTNFTAKYKVTVPETAAPGSHFFPHGNCSLSWLEYHSGKYGPYTSCTIGDIEVVVTVGGGIVGETRDVNAGELPGVTVTLYKNTSGITSDTSTPNYTIMVNATGDYWLSGSKYQYFDILTNALPTTPRNPYHPDYINLTTPELLAAGYTLDFEGDYGLVPICCAMSYAMKSVNHWLFTPIDNFGVNHTEWQLSNWKAMESIHSWQFPCECD